MNTFIIPDKFAVLEIDVRPFSYSNIIVGSVMCLSFSSQDDGQ